MGSIQKALSSRFSETSFFSPKILGSLRNEREGKADFPVLGTLKHHLLIPDLGKTANRMGSSADQLSSWFSETSFFIPKILGRITGQMGKGAQKRALSLAAGPKSWGIVNMKPWEARAMISMSETIGLRQLTQPRPRNNGKGRKPTAR